MNSLRGTQTEKNLLAAFAGESQARNRYTFFASQAKKKGMNKSPRSSWRLLIMKKNMRNDSLSFLKVEKSKLLRPIRQELSV